MASSHAARQWLEAFKFSVYLGTPIVATIYLGTGAYPYLERFIHKTAYVVYPAEGPVPPKSAEEVERTRQGMKEALARKREGA